MLDDRHACFHWNNLHHLELQHKHGHGEPFVNENKAHNKEIFSFCFLKKKWFIYRYE